MQPVQIELLRKLALARSIEFRSRRLPQHRWLISSDGARLHYLDWPGGSDTLLLLHGGRLSAHTFDLLALALPDAVRCIAIDLRGHGLSEWDSEYSIDRWVADVIELADELALKEVHVAGMSLGGCIAGHAAPLLAHRLKSLAFIDVADRVNYEASARMRDFFENVRQPVCEIDELVKAALTASPRTDPDLMSYRYLNLLKPGPSGLTWQADPRRRPDHPNILKALSEMVTFVPQISCPVLVVKGGQSRILDQQYLEQFAGRFAHGMWIVVPNAGHNVQEDQPVLLANALLGLMAKATRP
jgi:3-oxoadipate enol-lactonase